MKALLRATPRFSVYEAIPGRYVLSKPTLFVHYFNAEPSICAPLKRRKHPAKKPRGPLLPRYSPVYNLSFLCSSTLLSIYESALANGPIYGSFSMSSALHVVCSSAPKAGSRVYRNVSRHTDLLFGFQRLISLEKFFWPSSIRLSSCVVFGLFSDRSMNSNTSL